MSDPAVPLTYPTGSPAAVAAEGRSAPRSFVSYAKLLGAITFLSRILGMAREAIAAGYFGRSPIYSAFQLAFTIPNLFRKLLGEGALSAAFIPLYAQAVKRENAGEASDVSAASFAVASVNLLCAVCLALTIVGELLLALLVGLVPMPWDYLLAA